MKTALLLAVLFCLTLPVQAQEPISDCRYTDVTRKVVVCLVGGKLASFQAVTGNRHWDYIVAQQIPVADPE